MADAKSLSPPAETNAPGASDNGLSATVNTAALESRIDALKFAIEKSLRYHQRRRGFFDAMHNAIMFGVIICGSAAFAGESPKLAGAIAALIGALDLVFQFSHKARDHQSLFQRFSELNLAVATFEVSHSKEIDDLVAKRLKIEADEPPVFWALEADCDNETAIAWGRNKSSGLIRIEWHQRLFMNFWRFDRTVFPDRRQVEVL